MRNTDQTIRQRLFVGSSTESLDIAYAIQENLKHEFEVSVWSQGIFDLGTSAWEALVSRLEDFDAAVFVFSPQDELRMRGKDVLSARDNVIFELGLFTGRLGRKRAFIVMPRGIE